MRLWKYLWSVVYRFRTLIFNVALIGLIILIVYISVAYIRGVFPNPDWTGFGTPERNIDGQEIAHFKTLWDWLGLLLVPAVLAVGGFFLNRTERINAEKAAEQRAKTEREIADQRAEQERKVEEQRVQDAALQSYLDQMTHLLLRQKLRFSQPEDVARIVARARTLTVLRVLDSVRKATVLQFLYEAKLIGGMLRDERGTEIEPFDAVVSLHGADLRGADLRGADLRGADLRGADLRGAHLFGAKLGGAHLFGANLGGAHLVGANLHGAYLDEADLHGADLYEANLRGGTSGQGAPGRGAPGRGGSDQGEPARGVPR